MEGLAVATWRHSEDADARVVVRAPPPFPCVTSDKSLAFSGPPFPVAGKQA